MPIRVWNGREFTTDWKLVPIDGKNIIVPINDYRGTSSEEEIVNQDPASIYIGKDKEIP
jgi:hypothetical protein